MKDISEIRNSLLNFKSVDKFKEYGHLQPAVENSNEEDKEFINNEFNSCCDELGKHLESKKPNDKSLKSIVRKSLSRIEDAELDTEDREFCYELYKVLEDILGIDIEDKSISTEQKLMADLQRLAKKGGIDLTNFLPSRK